MTEKILVTGAGGFIGGHLVRRLIDDGHTVIGLDRKSFSRWWQLHDIENLEHDLHHAYPPRRLDSVTQVYHLAADMGGIGYIENNKLACSMSTRMDINLIEWAILKSVPLTRLFYASSACVYPDYRQRAGIDVEPLRETEAYPAAPEDGYGWQKLYSERLMRHAREDNELPTRIGRFHNVYGIHGSWRGGREKAPAAICRKVAEAIVSGQDSIELWGDGEQARSFLHVDDCIEAIMLLTNSEVTDPVNIGSAELVTINDLARLVMEIAGIELGIEHTPGPTGVRGRSSDNTYVRVMLGWEPVIPLRYGLIDTYRWIFDQVVRHAR